MKLTLLFTLLLLTACASQVEKETDQDKVTKRSRYNLDR